MPKGLRAPRAPVLTTKTAPRLARRTPAAVLITVGRVRQGPTSRAYVLTRGLPVPLMARATPDTTPVAPTKDPPA